MNADLLVHGGLVLPSADAPARPADVLIHQGRIVEQGTRDQIFDAPQNDYTRQLLAAMPEVRF